MSNEQYYQDLTFEFPGGVLYLFIDEVPQIHVEFTKEKPALSAIRHCKRAFNAVCKSLKEAEYPYVYTGVYPENRKFAEKVGFVEHNQTSLSCGQPVFVYKKSLADGD